MKWEQSPHMYLWLPKGIRLDLDQSFPTSALVTLEPVVLCGGGSPGHWRTFSNTLAFTH